ncbi:MAG: response regulator [Planctomycetota bacterium]
MADRANVLLVDDDEQVRVALSKVFKRAGYDSSAVASAEEALTLIRKKPYDLVVADIVLGGMDGVELLGHIRESHDRTPVILVTAYSKEEYEEQAKEKGAYAYLRKPISREQLLETAEAAISARK